MNEGQKLRLFVAKILTDNKGSLTTSQKMTLDSNEGGDYEPSNPRELMGEILSLERNKNWQELIQVFRKLPKPADDNKITLFIDGRECSITDYLNSDKLSGVRTLKSNMKEPVIVETDGRLDAIAKNIFQSRFFELDSGSGGMMDPNARVSVKKHKKLVRFLPQAYDIITEELLEKELLRNYAQGTYKTVDEVLEVDGVQGYLTSVIANEETLEHYLETRWCGDKEIEEVNTYAPTPDDYKTKYEPDLNGKDLTEVEPTDEQIDAMENKVTVFGIDSQGRKK